MEANRRIREIIFLERSSAAALYLRGRETEARRADGLVIAMNPSVQAFCKKRGLPAQHTVPYFTNASHAEALEKSDSLVNWLTKQSEFIDLGFGIQRGYRDPLIFWTRLAIHYCLWIIETVLNAIERHQPDILSASHPDKKVTLSLFLEPEEAYFGYLVQIIARGKNLKYESLPKEYTFRRPFKMFNHVQSVCKFIVQYMKLQHWKSVVASENAPALERPIFFTTSFYQFDQLAKSLQQDLKRPFYLLPGPIISPFDLPQAAVKLFGKNYAKMLSNQRQLLAKLAVAIDAESELFQYKGVPFGKVISQKIRDNLARHVLGLQLWSISLNQLLNRVKPGAIVSNGNRDDEVLMAELSREKNIPTVLISHASHVRPKNTYERIEWEALGRGLLSAPFSHLAFQSPLAEGYVNAFPTMSKVLKTGPLIWGTPVDQKKSHATFKRMFKGRHDFGLLRVVLHAGTPKQSKGLRFYVYETTDEYIQALRELADTVEQIPNTLLIIKLRPSTEIGVDDIRTLVPFSEKVVLSVDEPFHEVLGLSDLLVSFSSTTIEEALQNHIPVLLYGGGGRYQHVPASQIKANNAVQAAAVYHVREAQDLPYAITTILDLQKRSEDKEKLFEPYIYPLAVRVSLRGMLQDLV